MTDIEGIVMESVRSLGDGVSVREVGYTIGTWAWLTFGDLGGDVALRDVCTSVTKAVKLRWMDGVSLLNAAEVQFWAAGFVEDVEHGVKVEESCGVLWDTHGEQFVESVFERIDSISPALSKEIREVPRR